MKSTEQEDRVTASILQLWAERKARLVSAKDTRDMIADCRVELAAQLYAYHEILAKPGCNGKWASWLRANSIPLATADRASRQRKMVSPVGNLLTEEVPTVRQVVSLAKDLKDRIYKVSPARTSLPGFSRSFQWRPGVGIDVSTFYGHATIVMFTRLRDEGAYSHPYIGIISRVLSVDANRSTALQEAAGVRPGFTRRPKAATPSVIQGKNYVTPGGIERLKEERTYLLRKDRPAVVEVVAWAASNGDRSENADYQYSKRRLRQIDGRVRFLTQRIEAAEVVDPEAPRNGQQARRVFFGATVRYANTAGAEREICIVGTDEVDLDRNHVSWASPLARALMRAVEEDEVVLDAPGGTETLTVLEVRYERIAVEPFHAPDSSDVSTNSS